MRTQTHAGKTGHEDGSATPLRDMMKLRSGRSALAVLFLIAIALVTFDALGLQEAAAAGTTVNAMAVAGALKETTTPDDHKVRDVSDAVTFSDESANVPLDQMMRRARKRKPVHNVAIEWELRDRTPARRDTVNGAATAGAAGAAKTIAVDNAALWRANDLIMLPNNATTAGALLLVTSTNPGAGTITVMAIKVATTKSTSPAAMGTVPAVADGEVMVRMTNSKTESDTPSASRIVTPDMLFNFIHSYDAVVESSTHRKKTKNYTSSHDLAVNQAGTVIDMRRGIEYNNFFGLPSVSLAENGELRLTQAGILHYVSQTIGYSIGNLSESGIVDIGEEVFTGNTGSKKRILFADAKLCSELDKLQLAKMQNLPTRMVAGVRTTDLKGRHGDLSIVHHPGFDEIGKVHFGVVVDQANVSYAELEALGHQDNDFRKTGVKDSTAKWWQAKQTLEVKNPETHYIIQGS